MIDVELITALGLVAGGGAAVALIGVILIIAIVRLIFRPLMAAKSEVVRKQARLWRKRLIGLSCLIIACGLIGTVSWAAWLTWHEQNAQSWFLEQSNHISRDQWLAVAAGVGRIVLAIIAAAICTRLVAAIIAAVQQQAAAWIHLKAEPASVETFFTGLTKLSRHGIWLMVLVYATQQLFLPESGANWLRSIIAVYLIISIGLSLARATTALVDTLDALSRLYLEKTSWLRYYDAVRPLIPLLRRCVEYALWIATASLALLQIEAISDFAKYGPRLMETIGIFFLARMAIELGHLLIDHRMVTNDDVDEARKKRNATFAPLLKSLYKGGVFFIAGVLVLGAMGFNPMPFLAGAGVLGVVIGLGAQPMINDLVSGFFIIFENQFLVGDTIEVDAARGVVESIDFRTTRVRDLEGRVHLLRNGDLKRVINFSNNYSNALVRIDIPLESDLTKVQAAFERADHHLRQEHADSILGTLELVLVENINDGHCTTRAIIKTLPTHHWRVAAAFRGHLRTAFHDSNLTFALPRQQLDVRTSSSSA